MTMRSLLTFAGSVIGLALPVVAQEQNTVDPEVRGVRTQESATKKQQ
jgi:hypothetical protein